MIYKFFFYLGVFIRNNKIFSHWAALRKTEFYTDEEINGIQLTRLRALLEHAKSNSPYYNQKLSGFATFENFQVSDMANIPILKKDDFRGNLDSIFAINYKKKSCFLSETSGSTGDALIFYRDKDWDAAHRSAIYRGIESFGVKPWSKSFYLWGFVFTPYQRLKMRLLDFLQNRKRLFIYSEDKMDSVWKYLRKCDYIEGYSSVINSIAVLALKNGINLKNIKMVKCTSEKIYPSYELNILKSFNVTPVSEYGAAETGIIAFSCPEGNMHVVKENIFLEVVDGRAVVTNLNSFSMPIIRYDLGDYIKMSVGGCRCGRHGEIVEDILGRVGKNIRGYSKEFPSLTLYYVFKYLALEKELLLSYQAVQNTVGKLDVVIFEDPKLVSSFDGFDSVRGEVADAFVKYFSTEIDVSLTFDTARERNAKLKDFVSNL